MLLLLPFLLVSAHPEIKKWRLFGGWPVGKNELDGDPAEAVDGGIFALHAMRKARHGEPPQPGLRSELLQDPHEAGSWRALGRADGEGWRQVRLRSADWNALVQGLSSVEVTEWQSLLSPFARKHR